MSQRIADSALKPAHIPDTDYIVENFFPFITIFWGLSNFSETYVGHKMGSHIQNDCLNLAVNSYYLKSGKKTLVLVKKKDTYKKQSKKLAFGKMI